jgi:uncharacterized protein (UPF0147 family)
MQLTEEQKAYIRDLESKRLIKQVYELEKIQNNENVPMIIRQASQDLMFAYITKLKNEFGIEIPTTEENEDA